MAQKTKINSLRKKIDRIDSELMATFVKRVQTVKEIQKLKNKNRLPIEDLKREKAIIDGLAVKFSSLDPQFIKQIYKVVFKFSKKCK